MRKKFVLTSGALFIFGAAAHAQAPGIPGPASVYQSADVHIVTYGGMVYIEQAGAVVQVIAAYDNEPYFIPPPPPVTNVPVTPLVPSTSGVSGGSGVSPTPVGPAALTPQAQTDCFARCLGNLGGQWGIVTSHNFPTAQAEPVSTSIALNPKITYCVDNASDAVAAMQTNIVSIGNQVPWNDLNANQGARIYLPECTPNVPYIFDPNAPGSLASLGSNALNNLANCNAKTPKALAVTVQNLQSNGYYQYKNMPYTAMVSAFMTDAFVRTMGWAESECRAFILNHERAHYILGDDNSNHPEAGDARFASMFSANGMPNEDGMALLLTLAGKGASQAGGLQNIINSLTSMLLAASPSERGAISSLRDKFYQAQGKFPC